jgi:hypothetical protein
MSKNKEKMQQKLCDKSLSLQEQEQLSKNTFTFSCITFLKRWTERIKRTVTVNRICDFHCSCYLLLFQDKIRLEGDLRTFFFSSVMKNSNDPESSSLPSLGVFYLKRRLISLTIHSEIQEGECLGKTRTWLLFSRRNPFSQELSSYLLSTDFLCCSDCNTKATSSSQL